MAIFSRTSLLFRYKFYCKSSDLCIKQIRNVVTGSRLVFSEFGDPNTVLHQENFTIHVSENLTPDKVLVKMLAAPVHPADINTIQGVYGVKPPLPAVPGNEGVGKILQVGSNVKQLNVDDTVIAIHANWGTWTTHKICDATDLLKVPKNIPWFDAATTAVNPVTAYRMLVDFVPLKSGDVVIQNAANSAVGQAVIQIARNMGLKTVNILRDRPEIAILKNTLTELGADIILTDEELRLPSVKNIFDGIPKPKLALNGVGGRIASDMLKWVAEGSVMVTYGGMSRQPLTLPLRSLIFDKVSFHGFWCGKYYKKERNSQEFKMMMEDIFTMLVENKLKPPLSSSVPFSDFKTAISLAGTPYINKKQILIM